MTFRQRAYDESLDVRRPYACVEQVIEAPTGGVLWLLVAPRRGRKTWTLKGLEAQLRNLGRQVQFVDLGLTPNALAKPSTGTIVLLDEPGTHLIAADQFLNDCQRAAESGVRLTLAVSPRELDLLRKADPGGRRVSMRGLLRDPQRLSVDEATEQASRADWGRAFVRDLVQADERWTASAYLLEYILEAKEENPACTVTEAIEVVIERCRLDDYLYHAYEEGLSDGQRDALRDLVRGRPIDDAAMAATLETAGLIMRTDRHRYRLADPVLEWHLAPLRIHHLSDIHFGPKTAAATDVKVTGAVANALDGGAVRSTYLEHLRGLHDAAMAPHLLVVSGDLAEYATSDQLLGARKFLEETRGLLLNHAALATVADRVLVVGGNHDVDWNRSRDGDMEARHQPFADAFAGYPRPQLEVPPGRRPLAEVRYPDLGLSFLLLGSAALGGEVEETVRKAQLLEELARLPATTKPTPEEEQKAEKLALEAARIDPGLVDKEDLNRVRAHHWDLPVRIAVLHHPVSSMPTTEVSRYAGLLNAGEVKDVLLDKRFCLVLHGHAHSGWFGVEHWPGRHDNHVLRIAAAPALGSSEVQEHLGFNVIEIYRDYQARKTRYEVAVHRYERRGSSWVASDRLPPFSAGA